MISCEGFVSCLEFKNKGKFEIFTALETYNVSTLISLQRLIFYFYKRPRDRWYKSVPVLHFDDVLNSLALE